jgi:hypothetical protein
MDTARGSVPCDEAGLVNVRIVTNKGEGPHKNCLSLSPPRLSPPNYRESAARVPEKCLSPGPREKCLSPGPRASPECGEKCLSLPL